MQPGRVLPQDRADEVIADLGHGDEGIAPHEAHLGLHRALLVPRVRVAEGDLEAEVQAAVAADTTTFTAATGVAGSL